MQAVAHKAVELPLIAYANQLIAIIATELSLFETRNVLPICYDTIRRHIER